MIARSCPSFWLAALLPMLAICGRVDPLEAQADPDFFPGVRSTLSRAVPVDEIVPDLLTDLETGSTWNVLGEAIGGPEKGRRLIPVAAYSAYWFGWASFWPQSGVWAGENRLPATDPGSEIEPRTWGSVKFSSPLSEPTQP